MRRVIHLARRDVALVRPDLEPGVRLRREHPALMVLPLVVTGALVEAEPLGLHHRQVLDVVVDVAGRDGLGRRERGKEETEVAA